MDREKIKQAFAAYTDNYDRTDIKIRLKIDHTYRVADISERIAHSLTDAPEELDTAWLLGMLHDIGRFEQIRRYGTFSDSKSVDHAELGADILFSDHLFQTFFEGEPLPEDMAMIETAIREHNKYRLSEDMDERTRMFCQILRDADKVDIMRVSYEIPFEDTHNSAADELYTSTVRDEMMTGVYEHRCVSRDMITERSAVEIYMSHCMLAFELVYDESRRIVQQQGYLARLLSFRSRNPQAAEKFSILKAELEQTVLQESTDLTEQR